MSFSDFTDKQSWAFNQSVVMKAAGNQCNAAHHGSCHNFSLEWLSFVLQQHADGVTMTAGATARRQHMSKMMTVKSAIVTQPAFGRYWGSGGYDRADSMMAQLRGLEMKTVMSERPYSITAITTVLNKTKRTGYVLTFWFTKGGGHSIALYRSGALLGAGHAIAFDPNLGEYNMEPNYFGTWLRSFFKHYDTYFTATAGLVNTAAMKAAHKGHLPFKR